MAITTGNKQYELFCIEQYLCHGGGGGVLGLFLFLDVGRFLWGRGSRMGSAKVAVVILTPNTS